MAAARERLEAARANTRNAEHALLESREALFVRGEEKVRLLQALDDAQAELAEAEAALRAAQGRPD